MPNTIIRLCSCRHEFQDARYGKDLRVHNLAKGSATADCTVCGTQKTISSAAKASAKGAKK